jgi:hypothetical protein
MIAQSVASSDLFIIRLFILKYIDIRKLFMYKNMQKSYYEIYDLFIKSEKVLIEKVHIIDQLKKA